MAQYQIAYSCGHTLTRSLFGKETERQNYIAWATKFGACIDCAAVNKVAACEAIEVEHDLPALSGSDKQIAWARDVRATKIADVVAFVDATRKTRVPADKIQEFEAQAAAAMQTLYGKTSAGFWIDARDKSGQALAAEAYKEARR